MSWNSVFLVRNDAVKCIETDPNFRKDLVEIISAGKTSEQFLNNRGFCNGAFDVIWNDRSQTTGVIAVGQNSSTILGSAEMGHATEELQVKLLKKIAKDYGYRLTKIKT